MVPRANGAQCRAPILVIPVTIRERRSPRISSVLVSRQMPIDLQRFHPPKHFWSSLHRNSTISVSGLNSSCHQLTYPSLDLIHIDSHCPLHMLFFFRINQVSCCRHHTLLLEPQPTPLNAGPPFCIGIKMRSTQPSRCRVVFRKASDGSERLSTLRGYAF